MEPIDYTPVRISPANWAEHAEALSRIRHAVFMLEQGVSTDEEWDGKDEAAHHWLAWDADGEPLGTARLLPDGQLGRMAVLESHRGRGVGSALLRAVIAHARAAGMAALTLNAQRQAIPLYQRHGFDIVGEVFDDAGMPHWPMRLILDPPAHSTTDNRTPTADSSTHPVDAVDNLPEHCEGFDAVQRAAMELVGNARRELLLFSSRLLPEVFDHDIVTRTLAASCLDSRELEVLLLVRDGDHLGRCHHRLLAQQQRMPSRIAVKLLDPAIHTDCAEFLAVDGIGVLELRTDNGTLWRHAPRLATELRREFLELWRVASTDPNLRRLLL